MSAVRIRGLTVTDQAAGVIVAPLDATLAPGRTLALIGESGSGKTLTAKSLVGLLPRGFRAQGSLEVDGQFVALDSGERRWRTVRGGLVSLLLQDPFTSLSPVHRCGDQIAWTARVAQARHSADQRFHQWDTAQLLAEVKLPHHVADAYPHQLSGGMRQRVAIAAALAANPQLLIADEPTTALDASNQADILDLLRTVQKSRLLSVLLISHDLGLVRGRTDDVLVMHKGAVVERGPTEIVLTAPRHQCTRALLDADPSARVAVSSARSEDAPRPVLVGVSGLGKQFGQRRVLENIDLRIAEGSVVGIVGESGSGKSTLARCIAGLERHETGTVEFDGTGLPPGRACRRPDQMQIVFQDPYSSLNPAWSVGAILREALRVAERPAVDVPSLLNSVGLPPDVASRRSVELSGGQRQRIAIARALAPRPRLLICDEPVSALDVSVQAQIVDLLLALRRELGLTLLFISHDLAVIRLLADEVVVLRGGSIVEQGSCGDVLDSPRHEYTRSLVSASLRHATTPATPH